MAMMSRYEVGRDSSSYSWLVVDTQKNEVIRTFNRRTNWIDGREGKPYGPEGAAREIARRLNEADED